MALASLTQWMRDNRELSVLKLDGVEWRDLKFPNSESYRGGWKDSRVRAPAAGLHGALEGGAGCCCRCFHLLAAAGLHPLLRGCCIACKRRTRPRVLQPEGEGCYTWADGSTYEGAWHQGLKHGWGTYRWPNGAAYRGEWRDGYMQVQRVAAASCGLESLHLGAD